MRRLLVIIYKKNLNDAQILIKSPEELGGTASEQYLKLSPQGTPRRRSAPFKHTRCTHNLLFLLLLPGSSSSAFPQSLLRCIVYTLLLPPSASAYTSPVIRRKGPAADHGARSGPRE
eukprot:3304876-Rhodomonas_salina.4